ncbi:cytochrome P450 [Sorangium cellulosum]|uniref:Cytochrome P450 n=1 Tax=Sorangium cellulosum TaxID=56 RepID=A0A4P2PWF8_SORCE|nr:cytochrome P450 [Sorangium cellulosum]AUX20901.1 cytochrome P450 [Sorangium cellulosum]
MRHRMDVLAPQVRANPYPHYAELRRDNPVCQVDPGGMWAVSRYADVLFVLKSPEIFSSQGFKAAWQPPWVGYNPLANSMLALDPPEHTRMRALIHRAFGARTVARLEPRVRAVAEELADGLAGGEVDFIDALAMPLPAFVIGEVLGLDGGLRARFKRWADDILSVTPDPEPPAHAGRIRTTIAELTGYLGEVVAARRRAPADDTVSDLIRAELDGQALTDTEIIDFLVLLLLGGLETTTHLLGNALRFLAEHPEMMRRLCAAPDLVPLFVEEALRHDGPSQSVPRLTTREVSLAGVTLPRGAPVLALVASANRDERQFPDPDRFDLHRGSHGGLQFGHGIHFCIGAALARMEARAALEALVARFRRVERGPGEILYNSTLTVRGPVALPLRFIAR